MLEVDVPELCCFVDRREIPEKTAEALYPHRLGVWSEGKTGGDGEQAGKGEDFWRKELA